MDGVLADFEEGFVRAWTRLYPSAPVIPKAARKAMKLIDDYPQPYRPTIEALFRAENFYADLPLVQEAADILNRLESRGFDVWVCSRPQRAYRYCVLEKYKWIERHFGERWTQKLVITRDKTLVRGDLLIDDSFPIPGCCAPPSWKQILFDAPYNRDVDLPRITWSNWEALLKQQGSPRLRVHQNTRSISAFPQSKRVTHAHSWHP